ncbi:MAG: hypothetical protein RBU27_01845 [Bacteroidota bacterium]|jgi:hypothetical protein|nr:hypothetical protein [Bacteroidota bacterium]
MKKIIFSAVLLFIATFPSHAQNGTAGAFTRLGFGARGQGMGNAMTTVRSGTVSTYYNPAMSAFQEGHVLHGSYSFLSLGRVLNQVSYTQMLRIYNKEANIYAAEPGVQSISGVSITWINAGDGDIQGYDSDGFKTEQLRVFENQFGVNFGTRFSDRLAVGFNAKFYYSGLYEGVTSSGFGLDVGILYTVSPSLRIGIVAQELLTKYKWDTSELYGPESGNATENPFARIWRAGVGYTLPGEAGLAAVEGEIIDGVLLGRLGVEVPVAENIWLRGGVERVDFSDAGIDPRPTFGFSIAQPVAQLHPVIHYAFILEPVAPSPTHVLSFALHF